MSNLITINQSSINNEAVQTVNARELHAFLETDIRFNDWIARRISEYEFIENQDFIIFTQKRVKIQRGRPSIEYHITLDMAKELSMVERNEKGREARKYFIACEKKVLTSNVIPLKTRLPEVSDNFIAAKKISEAIGLEGNQAVLSANVMTRKVTGVDVMELAEVKYLVNEEQELLHTPTQLGEKFRMSAQEINKLLANCGLQKNVEYKKGKKRWELTEKGREFGKYQDSGRKHSDGKPVMNIGWFETVLTELVKYGEKLKSELPMSIVSGFK